MAKQSRRAKAKLECQRALVALESFVLHVENIKALGYPEIDSSWATTFVLAQEGTVGLSTVVEWWLAQL